MGDKKLTPMQLARFTVELRRWGAEGRVKWLDHLRYWSFPDLGAGYELRVGAPDGGPPEMLVEQTAQGGGVPIMACYIHGGRCDWAALRLDMESLEGAVLHMLAHAEESISWRHPSVSGVGRVG